MACGARTTGECSFFFSQKKRAAAAVNGSVSTAQRGEKKPGICSAWTSMVKSSIGMGQGAAIRAGSRMRAVRDFNHQKNCPGVKKGMQGSVTRVDKDGDYLVKFDELKLKMWSFASRKEIVGIGARAIINALLVIRCSEF